MNSKELALKLDAEDKPIEAVKAYEEAIKEPGADLDIYLNLAVLYFVCTDFGYAAHHHLPDELFDKAWERMISLLDEAESRFDKNDEVDFWRRYFRYIGLGNDESVMEREPLKSSTSLIPYFYLFKSGNGDEYRSEAEKLYELVADETSAKKRYIKSILESNVEPILQKKTKINDPP
jgi:hypothetical protein